MSETTASPDNVREVNDERRSFMTASSEPEVQMDATNRSASGQAPGGWGLAAISPVNAGRRHGAVSGETRPFAEDCTAKGRRKANRMVAKIKRRNGCCHPLVIRVKDRF
jgi:hypothetical protein